jgi:hypothetical protein
MVSLMFDVRVISAVVVAITVLGCTAKKDSSRPLKDEEQLTLELTEMGVETHGWGGEYGVALTEDHLTNLSRIAEVLSSASSAVPPIVLEIDCDAACSRASVFRDVEQLGGCRTQGL